MCARAVHASSDCHIHLLLQVHRNAHLNNANARPDTIKIQTKVLKSAYMLAAGTGGSCLFGEGNATSAPWQGWASGDAGGCMILAAQPELSAFPGALKAFLNLQPDGCALREGGLASSLRVVRGGVLAASVSWYEGVVMQTIHAGPKLWGLQWYDSVAVNALDHRNRKVEWYGQIRLLFWYKGEPLAFIRWYTEVNAERGDIFSEMAGGKCLTAWEATPHVIHIRSILRRIYVVPNFKRGAGHFHICNTKWDRHVPR